MSVLRPSTRPLSTPADMARRVVGLLIVLSLLGADAAGRISPVEAAPAGRDVIVVLKKGADARRVAKEMKVDVSHVYRNVFNGFSGRLPEAATSALGRNPQVAIVADDAPIRLAAQTLPAGIDRVDADHDPDAAINGQDLPRVDAGIAILDSGIDRGHPDLNVAGGVNCVTAGADYDDDHGHGTHVAGIAAANDNGASVVGVAPGARLYAVKVLDAQNRYSSTSALVCGLDWVLGQGSKIDVVNMSLGGRGTDGSCASTPLHQAVCAVTAADIPIVVAAMNEGIDAAPFVPATYDEVITVSAFADADGAPGGRGGACGNDQDDRFAAFSNFGPDVDIAAPGACVLSTTRGGGTGRMSGTSMATPHVTGALALFAATHPGASTAEARAWLLGTATRPQGSASGFGGDPDGSAEPVLALTPAGDGGGTPGPGGSGDPPPAGPRLAVTAYDQSANANDGGVAGDGDLATTWVASHGRAPRSASLSFDLGQNQSLGAVRWRFGRVGFADTFKIQVSSDQATWRTIATRHGASGTQWVTLPVDDAARYVRFLFANPHDDRRLGYLSEVELYGSDPSSGGL